MTQQEYENKIKELQDELEQLKAAKIEAEQPKRWKPENRRNYWTVARTSNIDNCYWMNDRVDSWLYLTGNCFKTKEEAEEYKKQIEYTARYKNYIEEHSEPLDWKDLQQDKYFACYDFYNRLQIVINNASVWKGSDIYASSEKIIKAAIKEIGEDNFKKYVLGVK